MRRVAAGAASIVVLGAAACAAPGGAVPVGPAAAQSPPPSAADARAPAAAATPTLAPDAGPGVVSFANVFLGNVPFERRAPGPIGGRRGARLAIEGNLADGAKELERRGVSLARRGGTYELVITGYPSPKDRARDRDRQASFVVDFDTAPVRGARAKAVEAKGDQPTMRDLTGFVAAYIEQKNLSRGYDIASVVARRREGDCSEHAVLLAALGRSFGFAVRVVHGVVLVDQGGALIGGMHAWTEWHDGKEWAPADAAIGSEHDPVYLPLETLDDEGPSFGRGLLLFASREIRGIAASPK
ncbi:MAG: lasso peptide biosynthesis protein [Deltaproteobacteria bacterium]|nr:lasso peptide biosynthesis protein [Deltaproteobacteria bacterium]